MTILKYLLFIAFIYIPFMGMSQINLQDSSAQAISYWDLGEQYEYTITLQNLRYKGQDTVQNETISYEVDITVIDSTANTYTVRWDYKNFSTNTPNPIMRKLLEISNEISVEIQTDEMGAIKGVVNWEEVKKHMEVAIDSLKKEVGIPAFDQIFNQTKQLYATKQSIEAGSIQDAQQFHNFHGGLYPMNEVLSGTIQTPNLYDNARPFDSYISVSLEEIDVENSYFIIRSLQEVDSTQLTDATYLYLKKMASNFGKEFPERKDFQTLNNTIETVSSIHDTGWVIESKSWKIVVSEGVTGEEIRTIKMK